ncbi:uncharacterized protein L199_006826 [Kwoniella botswanensis]|uniref:uncharacterized protein n=1 Tax=Kwoniella botswanensis TaxID=1268659 RepID=UPI00315DBC51
MNVVNNTLRQPDHGYKYENRVEQGREGDDKMEVDEQGQGDGTNADQNEQAQDLDYSYSRSHSHSHTSHFSIRQDSSIHPLKPSPSSSSSSSTSSTLFSNPNVHRLNDNIATTLTLETSQSNSKHNNNDNIDKTDNQRLLASSPSYTHIEHSSFSSNPTPVQHAQSLPPILSNTQNPFTAQSHPTPVPISQSTPSHNNNRPVPLHLTSQLHLLQHLPFDPHVV